MEYSCRSVHEKGDDVSGKIVHLNRAVVLLGILVGAIAVILITSNAAHAAQLAPGGSFVDDNESIHEASIEAIAAEGITTGCNPPTNDRFCPTSFGPLTSPPAPPRSPTSQIRSTLLTSERSPQQVSPKAVIRRRTIVSARRRR